MIGASPLTNKVSCWIEKRGKSPWVMDSQRCNSSTSWLVEIPIICQGIPSHSEEFLEALTAAYQKVQERDFFFVTIYSLISSRT